MFSALLCLSFMLPAASDAAAEELRLGRAVYRRFCASCHGERGDGRGAAAHLLDVPPRDFTRGEYLFRTTPYASLPVESDVFRTVTRGLVGTPMPGFGAVLSASERLAVSRYVLSLAPPDRRVGEPLALGDEPPPGPERVERGRALFVEIGCAHCHGTEGRGDGVAAAYLVDSAGAPRPPANLTRGYFKAGRTTIDVFRAISTGLSGTAMPSFAGVATVEERWAIAAYVMSLADGPSWFEQLFELPSGRGTMP